MTTVRVEGVDQLVRDLRRAGKEAEKAARKVLKAQGEKMKAHAQNACPVQKEDGGALKKSIRVLVSEQTLEASITAGGKKVDGVDVYYAQFVEYGTRDVKKGEATSTSKRKEHTFDRQGIKESPFMRSAERAYQEETFNKLSDVIAEAYRKGAEG